VLGDVEVDDAPAVVSEHDDDEEGGEASGRHGKEVDGDQVRDVIGEKRPPGLRGAGERLCLAKTQAGGQVVDLLASIRQPRRLSRTRRVCIADRAGEPVSASGARLDEVPVGAEDLAQRGQLRVEIVLVEHSVGPRSAAFPARRAADHPFPGQQPLGGPHRRPESR
jgi:hypothetical protein